MAKMRKVTHLILFRVIALMHQVTFRPENLPAVALPLPFVTNRGKGRQKLLLRFRSSGTMPRLIKSFRRLCARPISFRAAISLREAF